MPTCSNREAVLGLYSITMRNQLPKMTTDPAISYEQVEKVQRSYCEELDQQYVAARPDLKVGFALETRGRIPINGLRHPPEGDTTGWYLWCGEEFPSGDDSFLPYIRTT